MRSKLKSKVENFRLRKGLFKSDIKDGPNGAFIIPHNGTEFFVIASDGMGWDHVSVSTKTRCPTWDEMCWIKNLFFENDETVIQIHPPQKNYINLHSFCLHMWRNQNQELIMPPIYMV